MKTRSLLLCVLLASGCGSDTQSPGLGGIKTDGPPLASFDPGTLMPGTLLVLTGSSFVPPESGSSRLRLNGTLDGTPAEAMLPAVFEDYNRMSVRWPGAVKAGMPSDRGTFNGNARIVVDSFVDNEVHESPPMHVNLKIATALDPYLSSVQVGSAAFVNEPIRVTGGDFLLGGQEGTTSAIVEGCFQRDGTTQCKPVGPVGVPCAPDKPFDRSSAIFPFHPVIAGIHPGSFQGSVKLRNDSGGEAGQVLSESRPLALYLQKPAVFGLSPARASLGQFVMVEGGGFVGGDASQHTVLRLAGTFSPDNKPPIAADLELIPEFVSGQLALYVLNTDDQLGQAIDLRMEAGVFQGTVRPEIRVGAESELGAAVSMKLGIDRVRQVVWLRFMPSYVESLRYFGLRAADQRIRDRVLEVARRDYEGINLEFRTDKPQDFALYATVEISGPDPNGLGLLGYDNTPGKDQNNMRLYDKIGGVNASTQDDGYPGFGGVFVESFFGFSMNPGKFAKKVDGAEPIFDQIFDPFRPDRAGVPVDAADLASTPAPLNSSHSCPAVDRPTQIVCAVWALGSMIGTTMTHEVAHSLGLADPYGPDFHNPGDMPNRLMDSGGARSLRERMEMGEGPAMFCEDDYLYLRKILPTALKDPRPDRPNCY
jgi:hypothetical protein